MIFLALRGVLFISVIGCYSVALLKLINEFFVSRYNDYLKDEIAKNPRLQGGDDSSLALPPSSIIDDDTEKFNFENDNKFQNNYKDDTLISNIGINRKVGIAAHNNRVNGDAIAENYCHSMGILEFLLENKCDSRKKSYCLEKNCDKHHCNGCRKEENQENCDGIATDKNKKFINHNHDQKCSGYGLSFIPIGLSTRSELQAIKTKETVASTLSDEGNNQHKRRSEKLIESHESCTTAVNSAHCSDTTSVPSTPSIGKKDTNTPLLSCTDEVENLSPSLAQSAMAGSENKIKISKVCSNSDYDYCSSRHGYNGDYNNKSEYEENENVKTGDKHNHNNLNGDNRVQKDNCFANRKVVNDNNNNDDDDDDCDVGVGDNNAATDELWLEYWTDKKEKLNNDGEIIKNDLNSKESDENFIENEFCPVSYTNNDQTISLECD